MVSAPPPRLTACCSPGQEGPAACTSLVSERKRVGGERSVLWERFLRGRRVVCSISKIVPQLTGRRSRMFMVGSAKLARYERFRYKICWYLQHEASVRRTAPRLAIGCYNTHCMASKALPLFWFSTIACIN